MDNINTSLIVKWLRLPMALLVIFIHMTPHLNPHFTPVYSIDWQSLSPDNMPISTSIWHIYQVTGIIAVFPLANTMIKKLKYINQFIFKHSNASFFIYVVQTVPIVVTSPLGFASLLIDKTLYISGLCRYSGGGDKLLLNSICMSFRMHNNV